MTVGPIGTTRRHLEVPDVHQSRRIEVIFLADLNFKQIVQVFELFLRHSISTLLKGNHLGSRMK